MTNPTRSCGKALQETIKERKKKRGKKKILREASTPPRSALASDLCLDRSPYLMHLRVGPGLPGPKIQGVPGLSIPWRHPQARDQGTFRHEAQTPHGARPGFRRLGSVRIRAWCHPQALSNSWRCLVSQIPKDPPEPHSCPARLLLMPEEVTQESHCP